MFSSLISILSETTLSEGKLTEAAIILRDKDEKIIDVAFKFGYKPSNLSGTALRIFMDSFLLR